MTSSSSFRQMAFIAALSFPLVVLPAASAQPVLTRITPPATSNGSSAPVAISEDGTSVVCRSSLSGGPFVPFSFVWHPAAATNVLPNNSNALGLSRDNTTVLGGLYPQPAFRWTPSSGYQTLPLLPGCVGASAFAGTSNGLTIVGTGYTYASDGFTLLTQRAFRWVSPSSLLDLGVLPGRTFASATDITADGSVIVGYCEGNGRTRPFRWTSATGMVDLGDPAVPDSKISRISFDGTVLAGALADGSQALRWTAAGGVQLFPPLPGYQGTAALGMNKDGSLLCGWSTIGGAVEGGWIWSAGSGTVDIASFLAAQGVNTIGWSFKGVVGLNASGSAAVGYASLDTFGFSSYLVTGLNSLCQPAAHISPAVSYRCPSGTTSYSANATGPAPITYQWQWRPLGATAWINIVDGVNHPSGSSTTWFTATGSQASSVSITNVPAASQLASARQTQLRVLATNSCGQTAAFFVTFRVCPADFNCSSLVSVQDVFDFLTGWFAGSPSADFNGAAGVTVQDIFDFLAAWFAPC